LEKFGFVMRNFHLQSSKVESCIYRKKINQIEYFQQKIGRELNGI